jgi:hypothetical protein
VRAEAADVLKEFDKDHPGQLAKLLPNRPLRQITSRLRAITAES